MRPLFSLPHNTADGPVNLRVLVSLPPTYPSSAPPQLQLFSKYIGNFGADSALFGAVLRTYISINGVEWNPDTVCVFDGLQSVVERCTVWYEDRLSLDRASGLLRMDGKEGNNVEPVETTVGEVEKVLPVGIEMHIAEPIVDRKSIFVGRACRITDADQVNYSVLKVGRTVWSHTGRYHTSYQH